MTWIFGAAFLFLPALVFFAVVTSLRGRMRAAVILILTALLVVPFVYPLLPVSNLTEPGSENAMTAQTVIWVGATLLGLSGIVGGVIGIFTLHIRRSKARSRKA